MFANHARCEFGTTFNGKHNSFGKYFMINIFLKTNLLQVQNHFGNVFGYAFDGSKLVVESFNLNPYEGISLQRAKQYPAKGITNG